VKDSSDATTHKIYIKVNCERKELKVFDKTFDMTTLHTMIFGGNVLLILLFISYLCCWGRQERQFFHQHMLKYPRPSDYTIELKNLPQNMSEKDLMESLYRHMLKFASKYKLPAECIIDVNISTNNDVLDLQHQIAEIDEEMTDAIDTLQSKGLFEELGGRSLAISDIVAWKAKNPKEYGRL